MVLSHALLAGGLLLQAAGPAQPPQPQPARVSDASAQFRHDQLMKAIDDLQWQLKLGDIADVDKATYTSLPPRREPNPTAQGAGNPLIINAYTFIPKKLDRSKKQPLIVLVHGGVHSNFSSSSAHIVREMIGQGYSIIAPEYRGSTGYGAAFHRAIDYGGREVDDVLAGGPGCLKLIRSWMRSGLASWAGATAG